MTSDSRREAELGERGGAGKVKISTKIREKIGEALHPAAIHLLKVKNRNTRTRCEICSKLAIKIPEQRVSIVNFEQVNAGWVKNHPH